MHVRMYKKLGWLHGEVDTFDSHEQGWYPPRNLLEWICCVSNKTGSLTPEHHDYRIEASVV